MAYKQVQWTDEKVKKFWDYESQFPEKYFTFTFSERIVSEVKEHIVDAKSVLDYGTGIGLLMNELLDQGFEVTGMDFSHESIAKVTAKHKGKSNFKGVLHIDEVLSVKKKYDVIFCIEMIEHINDHYLDITFNNFKHLLSDNGKIIITTPNDEMLADNMIYCPECESVFHRWQHVKSWTTSSLEQTVFDHGLKKIDIFTTFFGAPIVETKSMTAQIAKLIRKFVLNRPAAAKHVSHTKPPHLVAIIRK